MTRDELLQAVTDIGTIEDAAERRSKLTAIHTEVSALFDTNENLTSSNTKLEADKKKLQEYNMELYLKVGQPNPNPEKEEEKQEEELSYDDLFNDKGDLI